MSKYKKFTWIIITSVVIVYVLNYLIWTNITQYSVLNNEKTYKGDLARNIYKLDSIFERSSYLPKPVVNLNKEHIETTQLQEYETVDVITIGDSFSNADTQGLNPFYQDYIATYKDLKVLNIARHINPTNNFMETINMMLNNGIIDSLKPKYILIQSVERFVIERFSKDIDFTQTYDKTKMLEKFKIPRLKLHPDSLDVTVLNDKNYKALKNNIYFKINKYDKFGGVYISKMKRDFFSCIDKNSLLFYDEDIRHIPKATVQNVEKLNDNFNTLSEILKKKGIKLYFMPAVDKYNLYSKYILNNSFAKSQFFELLRKLPKKYEFIDTKAILEDELQKGVLDIFYCDDTHWSYKASEAIIKKVRFE